MSNKNGNLKIVEKNVEPEEIEEVVIHPTKLIFQKFYKNKMSVFGAVLFLVILSLVIAAPLLTVKGGDKSNLKHKKEAPSSAYVLGTDDIGRDMLSRVLYGGQTSLKVAFIASLISTVIGSIVGAVAGYYGKRIDNLLMRFTELVMTFPYLPTVITISFALQGKIDPKNKIYILAIIIGLFSWTGLARMVRGQILSLREQEFMEATTALGLSDYSKIFKHLLPNTLGIIMVSMMLSFAGAILAETALSFLGLGVDPPTPSWGNIIQVSRKMTTLKNNWWMWLPCGVLMILTVVSINLMGEGLRDAFDPKSNN